MFILSECKSLFASSTGAAAHIQKKNVSMQSLEEIP